MSAFISVKPKKVPIVAYAHQNPGEAVELQLMEVVVDGKKREAFRVNGDFFNSFEDALSKLGELIKEKHFKDLKEEKKA